MLGFVLRTSGPSVPFGICCCPYAGASASSAISTDCATTDDRLHARPPLSPGHDILRARAVVLLPNHVPVGSECHGPGDASPQPKPARGGTRAPFLAPHRAEALATLRARRHRHAGACRRSCRAVPMGWSTCCCTQLDLDILHQVDAVARQRAVDAPQNVQGPRLIVHGVERGDEVEALASASCPKSLRFSPQADVAQTLPRHLRPRVSMASAENLFQELLSPETARPVGS